MNKIDLWTAIAKMREMTARGTPFSFAHGTWNIQARESNGVRYVDSALLRPAAKGDDVENADHKLFYKDLNLEPSKANRNCWQVLIVELNGEPVSAKNLQYENI